jgi:hypothetical protein
MPNSKVTVADLIRFLERQDPKMTVRVYDSEMGQSEDIIEYYVDREHDCIVIQ